MNDHELIMSIPGPKSKQNAVQVDRRTSRFYKMDHASRGLAIIFNHERFDNEDLKPRTGTKMDGERLQEALGKHGFKIDYHMDPTFDDIQHIIKTRVTDRDHSDEDCILIAILTHGHDGDYLSAKNNVYKLDKISDELTAEKCPTLAGKPKLFFIQACRGVKKDYGTVVYDTKPFSESIYFKIPSHADFFLAYSTIPGYVAYRDTCFGSWFIEALCEKLNEDDSHSRSIFQLITDVVSAVAIGYDAHFDEKKQIPSFTSRLMKDLVFGIKNS